MKSSQMASLVLLNIALATQLISISAHAETDWQKAHPRRAEVNGRLNNQQKRVDQGLANGQLKPGQAQHIQNQDARIHNQERRDAAKNGGHITKAEQGQLNHEENHVSHEINHDEKGNAASGAAPAPAPAAPAAQPPAQ